MPLSHQPSQYGKLVRRSQPGGGPSAPSAEQELDQLLERLEEQQNTEDDWTGVTPDPVQALRERMLIEFVPIFVELVEKYTAVGIAMHMDASNFLQGGREISFEFGIGEFRSQLMGTVTSDAIAFHETRHAPDVRGELASGPMLRIRNLNGPAFRDFICERLNVLLRLTARRS